MLDAQGGLRLVDFGAAVPVVNDRRRGTGAFTPGFAAPELRRIAHPGAIVDARADLYSLGAILFQGLSEGNIDPLTLAHPLECEFPVLDVGLLRPEVPPSVRDLVERSLARDPRERFSSAEEMRTAIERVMREA